VDFKSQLTSIRSKAPEAIFIPGYYSDVAILARQARELGIKVPLLGGDGWSSPKLIEIGGEAMEGAYFSSHFAGEGDGEKIPGSPEIAQFVAEFATKFGNKPNGLSALGYDAACVLAEATTRASVGLGSLEVRNALAQLSHFQAMTGQMTMGKDRNIEKAAVILKVSHGKFTKVERMLPIERGF
jgi:branched-chain amino acid transport system substrate-binding protein